MRREAHWRHCRDNLRGKRNFQTAARFFLLAARLARRGGRLLKVLGENSRELCIVKMPLGEIVMTTYVPRVCKCAFLAPLYATLRASRRAKQCDASLRWNVYNLYIDE